MLNWIRERIIGAAASVGDLKARTVDALVSFLRTLFAFFAAVRTAWGWYLTAVRRLRDALTYYGRALYSAVVLLNRVIIPRWVRQAIILVTAYINGQIQLVRALARRWVHELTVWVTGRLAALADALVLLRAFTRTWIGWLRRWVTRFGLPVVDLVLHPEKLAAWLLPALWGPLWRFLDSRATVIARWLLSRSVPAVLGVAHRVEDVIARIL